MRYHLNEIAAIAGGRLEGPDHIAASALTDSRTTSWAPEPVFFAIAGLNHDGHGHIGELYGRGVRGFVVERPVDTAAYPGAGFVHVESSVRALQLLAAHHRNTFAGTVVGITGSNGKTVVKEWAAQIAPHGMTLMRSPRSYNSQIGVPLSVLMIRGDEDVALIEAGISRPGEMALLERIIRPDIGIVTTLGDAHQENFRDLEQKLQEKLILFRRCPKIIYNSRYPAIGQALRREYPGAQLIDAARQTEAYARFSERTAQENAAAVAALYDAMSHPHAQTVARLALLQPVAMRLELREGIGGAVIIDDFYNADIHSLGIALDYLRSVAAGRPEALILSDILQSGLPDTELYGRVAEMVVAAGIGRMVGIGEKIKAHAHLFPAGSEFYLSTDACLAMLDQSRLAGHTVLIKGNRNAQFEKLSHALQLRTHTTTLEVDLDAMSHNLNHLRSKLRPGTKVMAMIKAFAYGNGGYEVASMLQRQGVDYLAVAFADEGVALRERGITAPVVVLNADQDSFELMISSRLEPEIYNFTSLEAFLGALARHSERDYPVHVKLDTGMHRLGFVEEDLPRLIERLAANPLARVASVFSHLAASDEASQADFSQAQCALFDRMSSRIVRALGHPVVRHLANSAAVERLPQTQFDMVRMGIGLYGVSSAGDEGLRTVSTLKTRIVQIKRIPAGDTVGYGRAGRAAVATRLATVPVGYADGLSRQLGEGRWSMLVNGRPAPTIGRICMDTCMLDITGIDAAEGDTAVVFGPASGNRIEQMAAIRGTIPYEIMTSVSTRVKRIFIKE